jgi:DNA-binding CsgD family transcriptional regulator
MVQESALGPIIERIHGAALDPGQWSGVVADLAKLCGAHTGIIYEFDRVRGTPTVMGTLQIDPSRAQLYERHYYTVDPWNRHAMSSQIGRVTLTHQFMRDADFLRSEFYQDYLRQSDIFYALGTTVERTPDHMAVFGVQRGHRKGPFSQEAANMVESIAPHLRQAYLTRRTLRTVTQMCATLTETLHLVASPVLIVDGGGRLQFANRAAEILLNAGDGLRLNRGTVTPSSRDQVMLFAEALASLARGLDGARTPAHDLAIQRPASDRPLLLRFAMLPRGDGGDEPRIAIFVDLAAGVARSIDRLQQALRLTKAETRLLAGLVAGESLAALSDKHRVSVNTLRVHLSRLFQKTGTHRQAELVRFALTAGGFKPDSP